MKAETKAPPRAFKVLFNKHLNNTRRARMDGQSAFQLAFHFGMSKPVVVEPSAAQVSSDAGLLPFRQLDEKLGFTEQLAACLFDRRHVGYVGHTFLEMVRMRVYGILADYADQNDPTCCEATRCSSSSVTVRFMMTTWPASRRCHASRMPSTRARSFVCGTC